VVHGWIYARGFDNPWLCTWFGARELVPRVSNGYNEFNHHFAKPTVACAMCPSAEAVRGWCALNRSTVCTGARLRTGLSFYA
jgi:hypothetical protein